VNTWASLWHGVVTGGRPVVGNLAGEDTRALSSGDLEEKGGDTGRGNGLTGRLACGDGTGSAPIFQFKSLFQLNKSAE
jgi:hypothetical protein